MNYLPGGMHANVCDEHAAFCWILWGLCTTKSVGALVVVHHWNLGTVPLADIVTILSLQT